MLESEQTYDIRALTDKAREIMDLDDKQLRVRRVRDYVLRVLDERPGQGSRAPYTNQTLFKLLFLLRLSKKAPHLTLEQMAAISREVPSAVLERVALGQESLVVPDLSHASLYLDTGNARFVAERAEWSPAESAREPRRTLERPDELRNELAHSGPAAYSMPSEPAPWVTVLANDSIEVRVRGRLDRRTRRRLRMLADLAEDIVRDRDAKPE